MLVRLYDTNTNPRDVRKVAEVLDKGGVIIYPTDSVYAFGCKINAVAGVEKITRLAGKDENMLTLICSSISQAAEYARIDNAQFRIIKRNTPGPFTFILPAGNRLPKIFKNRKEVGIRIPNNSIVQEICKALGAPLLSTSLKVGEHEDIEYMTQPELIDEKWGDRVDLIIDGGEGGTEQSTIINCVDGEAEIIRQGKGEIIDN